MKVQIENGYLTAFATVGDVDGSIEVSDCCIDKIDLEKMGFYKWQSDKAVFDKEKWQSHLDKIELEELYRRREEECFSVINRGALWYDMLTKEQSAELDLWYRAWLDAPQTKIIPVKPDFI